MEESNEMCNMSFCYSCSSTKDEKRLSMYIVRNEALRMILQLNTLCLCYVCKRLAEHADLFIQNVQTHQMLLENFANASKTTIEAIKTQIKPLINLSHLALEPIVLPIEENDITNKDTSFEKTMFNIKMELKDEDDTLMMDNMEFGDHGDEIDSYIKEEDEYPLKLLKQELESEGINIKCIRGTKKVKSKFDRKKKRTGRRISKDQLDAGNLDSHIEIVMLSDKELLKEREEMSKDDKYLNSLYKCTLCLKGFTFKGSYDTHMEKHCESRGNYECDICKLRMETADKLSAHQTKHRLRFKCTECNLLRSNRNTIRDHYTSHHCNGTYQYVCPQCTKSFKRQASLRKHILHVHNKKKVICDYCNKSYSGKHGLKNHLMLRHPEEVSATKKSRNFICKDCGMAFLSPSHLKIHSVKHSNARDFYCVECDNQSSSTAGHRSHPMAFLSPSHLKIHSVKHSNARDFYCVECDKSFKSETALKQHLKVAVPHVNYLDLPMQCDQCEKRFICRRDLESHANKVHYNIRPFQCDQCEKTYINKWGLKDHKRFVHEGVKRPFKFPCTMCDKVFDRKCILKGHLRTHTGERPYQCSKCSATFNQAGVLGTHMKLIHLKLTRDGRPKTSNGVINIE